MKATKWIWKGWLLAMALVAFLVSACTTGDAGEAESFDIRYEDKSTLTGDFEGKWSHAYNGGELYADLEVYSDYKVSQSTDAILVNLGFDDTITLTADSIQFTNLGSKIMLQILAYQMFGQAFDDSSQWPLNCIFVSRQTEFKSHVTRLGHTDDSVYLMIDKQDYSFQVSMDDIHFNVVATMSVPGVCVINYATRMIVVDINIEKLRAEGLEPGRIGSLGSEFEVTFSLPELLRFTAQF